MIFLNDSQVSELADFPSLMIRLAEAFRTSGDIPTRVQYDVPGRPASTLLVMPAWNRGASLGVKIVTVADGRRVGTRPTVNGVYVLLDRESGDIRAVLEAAALTAVRTASVCALAASRLAPPRSKSMLMIGSGMLAPHLIRAHAHARPLERIFLWGRDAARARRLAESIEIPCATVHAVAEIDDAIGQVDIVCAATPSEAPLVQGAKLQRGTYVALIGSFTPQMREADQDVIGRARIVVDTRDALMESGELIEAARAGRLGEVETLSDAPGAPHLEQHDFTVFKSVGAAIADLAVAEAIIAAACAAGRVAARSNL